MWIRMLELLSQLPTTQALAGQTCGPLAKAWRILGEASWWSGRGKILVLARLLD